MSVLSAVLAGNPGDDHPAILSAGRDMLNHGGLRSLTAALTSALRANGVTADDRIGVLMPDGADMALCCLAATEAGICVPLNPAYPPAELTELFALTEIRYLVTCGQSQAVIDAARAAGIVVLHLISRAWDLGFEGATGEPSPPTTPRSNAETAMVLLTSGSTAKPKLVPLTHANLTAALRNLSASLALSEADRCLNMMPMFHVGGLIDLFLAPLAAGGSVICAPAISAQSFFTALADDAPTWFQGVPTVLKDLLTHAETHGHALDAGGLRFIRSVSSALPGPLLEALETGFGVPVIEMFGMTETSGLIASNPMPPAARKPGSVGLSAGPEVAVVDEAGNPAPTGRSGEIVVRGATVTKGYLNSGLARRDFFIDDWLRTGDEGYLDADGYLFITGRIKEIINRGGEKISPRQIDDLVVGIAGIREAAAYATPHPTLGEDVALAIVLEPGAEVTGETIAATLAPHLAGFKIPRVVTVLDALPRVPSGKLDRKAIPASVEQVRAHARQGAFAVPETATQKLVARLWMRTLGVERVGLEDNFFDLGGDSLTATTFIIDLEAALRRTVPPGLLYETPTLRGFAEALEAPGSQTSGPNALPQKLYDAVRHSVSGWQGSRRSPDALIVGRNTLGSRQPLFWGAQSEEDFRALADALGGTRPIYGLRSLSRMPVKSDANTRILARHYADEIVAIQPEGNIHIGGFCEAGVVAFHVARALLAQGREISALLLQDRFIAEPFDRPVSFFWGESKWLFASDVAAAEQGWSKYYSGELSVDAFAIAHADWYAPGPVERFADRLSRELDRLEAGRPSAFERRYPHRPPLETPRFRVALRSPPLALVRPGQQRRLTVDLHNSGTAPLPASSASGAVVAACWYNFDGFPRQPVDARVILGTDLDPGESRRLELDLHTPPVRLPMVLRIDVLEEGIGWFSGRGSRPATTLMLPVLP